MRPRRQGARIGRREAIVAGLLGGISACSRQASASTGEPRWIDQRQVGPFVMRAAFPLSDHLMADADLAGLEAELRRVLSLGPCRTPIEVLLLSDQRQHRRLIRSRHADAPYRRALFYKVSGRSVVYAYRHAELAIDLRHEGTHALLHADLPMVPLWLDEGLAEYFEQRQPDRPRGDPERLAAVSRDARQGQLKTLRDLERKHTLEELSRGDYRYAWAWTHFLLHGPGAATTQLWAFLASIRRSEPPGDLSARLASVLRSPESAFLAHFRRWPSMLRQASRNGVDRG